MYDARLQRDIDGWMETKSPDAKWKGARAKLVGACVASCVAGVLLGGVVAAFAAGPSEDELAKLATLAARSTEQPASVVWMSARNEAGWLPWRNQSIAKRLLVDINVGRGLGETSHSDRGDAEPLRSYPGYSYNGVCVVEDS